jgi:hydrogenase expression/formation protein HypE
MIGAAGAPDPSRLACPAPVGRRSEILLGHGGGGMLGARLLDELILPVLPADPAVEPLLDGATIDLPAGRLAVTTDSFVVKPLFFPGGDIGRLAVNGSVNDVAMCGGMPRWMSLALIIEEGRAMDARSRVMASVGAAARAAGVSVVTGDTKGVERGKGDGIFINTTAWGIVPPGVAPSPRRVRPGDAVLLSGPIGLHGMAVMSRREGIEFDSEIRSDTAPLHRPVAAVVGEFPGIHCLRDPTRGGLSSALNEIAVGAGVCLRILERAVAVPPDVRAACEVLGLDPFYVANEGKMVIICEAGVAPGVLAILRGFPETREAVEIGRAEPAPAGCVVIDGPFGGQRILDRLSGEQLPRIC